MTASKQVPGAGLRAEIALFLFIGGCGWVLGFACGVMFVLIAGT